jgi:O-antigen chain-terminating methyltransferase
LAGPDEPAALEALRSRLEEEERAYAEVLAAVDRLASFPLPSEKSPEVRERLERLNLLFSPPRRPAGGGLGGALRKRAWDALAPALERQTQFNTALVQLLNAHLARLDALHGHLRELVGAIVHYAQRVEPLLDARARLGTALATTRSELVLEAFDRRLESLGRRLDGTGALRDRLETISEELRALRAGLSGPPPPEVARAVARAAEDSVYAAFENRFRGSREEIRRRVEGYVELFRDASPVVDLGCGRGEFLDALRAAGIPACGVDGNARTVQDCRARGLDVTAGDLLDFLRGRSDASLGGVFAAQVAEHLPPPVLTGLLAESHRVLRRGGLLLLETVNTRSVIGLLEVFHRDLTHERPLHPDTLSFLAAAAGFTDVRVELRSPVSPESRLQPVPAEGLPERSAAVLNENVERLNALLYGPLEYALLARR